MVKKIDQPVAAIPLPSADLITYRFDQTDKRFDELNETLKDFAGTFMTKEEIMSLKAQHDKDISDIWDKFADLRWYWRVLFSSALLAVATAVAALMIRR